MKVEIYSDIVCPWCYVGERRFEAALAQFADRDQVEVVFRPYQLDPNAPLLGIPLSTYLERRFGKSVGDMLQHVTESAAGEGISIDWDAAIASNTRNAHRLLGFAEREYGVETQRKLVDGLFAAHFTQGIDVGDVDALRVVAESAGIDRERARAYLASDSGTAELDDALREAADLGVSSVPTFVFDGSYAVQGAQPTVTFVQVLDEVKARSSISREQ
jgi:predicted DsbA family dithiol-disulfide isomerase